MYSNLQFDEIVNIARQAHAMLPVTSSPWLATPFSFLKEVPIKTRGKIGEDIITTWLRNKGFRVDVTPETAIDRIVNDKNVEIKFAMLGQDGSYTFNQLRNQNYDYVLCFGLSYDSAHCWFIPKVEIIKRWLARDIIKPQHSGKKGSDTAILKFKPSSSGWLSQYGGTLREGLQKIITSLESAEEEDEAESE